MLNLDAIGRKMQTNKIKISKQKLKDEWDLPWNSDLVVLNKIKHRLRWTTQHALVFKHPEDNNYYSCIYEVGSTERVEARP